MLLTAMMASGNLASVQPFPEHHPSCCVRSALFVHFVEGKCLTDMYIVTTGTSSTAPRLTQEYSLPAHDSLEKLDMTLRGLLSAERVWVWRVQTHNRLAVYTHSHLHNTGQCAHPLRASPASLLPLSAFSSINPRSSEDMNNGSNLDRLCHECRPCAVRGGGLVWRWC